jgi:hypothetical protein
MGRASGGCSLGLALLLCTALAGCGEKPQTASARKTDTAPAQGVAQAAYMAKGWKAGDAVNWEAHLKSRTQGQDEYTRTGAR